MSNLIDTADLTIEWLTARLREGRIKSVSTELQSSNGVYQIHRILAHFAEKDKPEAALLFKSPTENSSREKNGYILSRSGREAHFYTKLAVGLPQFALLDPCHIHHDKPKKTSTLLLRSHPLSIRADPSPSLTLEQARFAVSEIARLQAAAIRYCASDHAWLKQSPTSFNPEQLEAKLRRLESSKRLNGSHLKTCARTIDSLGAYSSWHPAKNVSGLVHGDYTAANLLFTKKRGVPPISILNWDFVQWGPLLVDVAFLIGSSLNRENRKKWTKDLLQLWYTFLAPDGSDIVLSLEDATTQYRVHSLYGVLHTLSKLEEASPTSETDVNLEILQRCCDQVQDLSALELITQSVESTPKL